jgi:hypothetical protein
MSFLNNFASLIKVKTIVTLTVIFIFAVLALRGDITPDNVMIIVSTVVSFYFGTQYEKKHPAEVPALAEPEHVENSGEVNA